MGDDDGFEKLLKYSADADRPNWDILSSSAYSSFSSDGDIPKGVPKSILNNLETLNKKAMVDFREIVAGERPQNNSILKF